MRHRLLLLSVLALAVTLHPGAQEPRSRIDVSKLGPEVGARVPDFTLTDQNGAQRSRQSIMSRRGAMLVFIRSADW